MLRRRHALLGLVAAASAALLAGCATAPEPRALPPVVFVHGNGDSAALWLTTLWRFESNGWPRDRLHAIDMPNPESRTDDTVAQPGRSSTTEHALFLKEQVERVLARTSATKVILVGNSRGGNAIRNYVQNHGGAAVVDKAVLGGTPNHGVWANAAFRPNNEFNGAGPFLMSLNAPKGPNGDEVTPGVQWMTLRSDNNDKFAQPDGVWIGARGTPTNVTAEGPALKGALNVVLPNRDHREVSYHPEAFAKTWEFITGRPPASTAVVPEPRPVLDGKVTGPGPAGFDNKGLAGATVEIYAVDPATGERRGAALHRQTTGSDGYWGPFAADPATRYEFVVGARDFATMHIYRPPLPRSSEVVHFRIEKMADADKAATSVVSFTRPRGYFGTPRDAMSFDGISPPPGIPPGVAGVAASKIRRTAPPGGPVVAEFNGERLVGRAWPAAENRLVVLELHD